MTLSSEYLQCYMHSLRNMDGIKKKSKHHTITAIVFEKLNKNCANIHRLDQLHALQAVGTYNLLEK